MPVTDIQQIVPVSGACVMNLAENSSGMGVCYQFRTCPILLTTASSDWSMQLLLFVVSRKFIECITQLRLMR